MDNLCQIVFITITMLLLTTESLADRYKEEPEKEPEKEPPPITIHIREPRTLGLIRSLFRKKRPPQIPLQFYADAQVIPDPFESHGNFLGPKYPGYPYRPPRPDSLQIGQIVKEPSFSFENILDDMVQSAGLPSFRERPYVQRPSKSSNDGLFQLINIRKLFSVPFSISSDPHSPLGFRLRIPYIAKHES